MSSTIINITSKSNFNINLYTSSPITNQKELEEQFGCINTLAYLDNVPANVVNNELFVISVPLLLSPHLFHHGKILIEQFNVQGLLSFLNFKLKSKLDADGFDMPDHASFYFMTTYKALDAHTQDAIISGEDIPNINAAVLCNIESKNSIDWQNFRLKSISSNLSGKTYNPDCYFHNYEAWYQHLRLLIQDHESKLQELKHGFIIFNVCCHKSGDKLVTHNYKGLCTANILLNDQQHQEIRVKGTIFD